MANEFKHVSVGTELTQTEYESIGGHVFDSQATGDIPYASSATQLSRLAIGSENAILNVSAGGIPEWGATLAGLTLTSPVFNTGVSGTAISTDTALGTSNTLLSTQGAIKSYVDAVATASDLDFQGDSGGALSIDLDSETLDIAGGTGIDTVGGTNTLTVNIDSTVATLIGTQTLTNKTLTAPVMTAPVLGTPASGVLTNTTGYTGDTSLVTTGVLNSGSINTGFGVINNGASAITTTGLVSAGSLTVTGTTTLNGNLILGDAATDTLTLSATIQGATPLIFEGASAGDYETSFAITNPTADRTITFPDASLTVNAAANISGTTLASNVVTSSLTAVGTIATGVWQGTAIASGYIAADAITGAKIADDAIDSEHYTDGSIDNDHIANGTIALAKTALVAGTNITLATNTLNVDDAFLKNDASDTTTGTITAAGFTTGNDGVVNFADDLPSTDHAATGVTVTITSSAAIAAGVPVYISGAGTVAAADADAAATMPAIGINTTDLSGGAGEAEILLLGIWHDETYNFTAGADVFVGLNPASSTAASDVLGITTTAPTGSGDTVQKVGVVLTADTVFVNFTGTEVLLA